MPTEIDLHQILADAFMQLGYAVDKETDGIFFPPLDLAIQVEQLRVTQSEGESCTVVLLFSCRHEKLPAGFAEIATGLGGSHQKAVEQACSSWIVSDFTPIHDYLCPSDTLLGAHAETASYAGELGEIIGWDLFFGPRLEASQHQDTIEITENVDEQQQIQQILFQPMTDSLFGQPGLYYIRIFMSKIDNDQIDFDCRVNGNEWEHGKNYLVDFITRYQSGAGVFYIKQNLLVVNKPADQIRSVSLLESLQQELDRQDKAMKEAPKKWWKFWG